MGIKQFFSSTSSSYNKLCVIAAYLYLIVSFLCSFFVTPIVLNQIGDSQYGLYSFCNSITNWLTTISVALGSSFVFFSNKYGSNDDNKRINTIYFKMFLILTFAVLAILIAVIPILFFGNVTFSHYSVSDSKLIYILLFISGINVCVSIITYVFYFFLSAKRQFLYLRIRNIFITILMYGFNVVFALVSKSIISIACVSLTCTIITNCLNIFVCLKIHHMSFQKKLKLKENKTLVKQIFSYSSYVLVSTIILTINNNLDKTILGIFVNPESVTFYTLAFSFISYLTFAIISISETYMPIFHEYYSKGENEKANQLFLKISKYQIALMTLFSFGFLSCGYDFVTLWIGPERIDVFYYAVALIFISFIPLSSNSCIDCERAIDKHKFRALILCIFTCLNIVVSIVLLLTLDKSFAIWSCIIGTAFSKICSEWIIMLIYDKKVLNLSLGKYLLDNLKYVIFGCISSVLPIVLHFSFKASIPLFPLLLIEIVSFMIIFVPLIVIFDRSTISSILSRRNRAEAQ